jgi:hypothetical protein
MKRCKVNGVSIQERLIIGCIIGFSKKKIYINDAINDA